MSTLAEKAISTYEEISMAREAEDAERQAKGRAQRLEDGKMYFRDVFKEEPVWNDEGVFLLDGKSHDYEPLAPVEKNPYFPDIGLGYGTQHGQHFNLIGICPRCQQFVTIGDVRSLCDLGFYLKNFEIPFHECNAQTRIERFPSPMEKLHADLETIETLLSTNGGSPAEKAAGLVRVVEAKALLMLAERLRRDE